MASGMIGPFARLASLLLLLHAIMMCARVYCDVFESGAVRETPVPEDETIFATRYITATGAARVSIMPAETAA